MIVDMAELKRQDAAWKPRNADEISRKLAELFSDTAGDLTINYMRNLGLGNKHNTLHPFQANMTRRMIESLSVCYAAPALRWLVDPETGEEYDDDSDEMDAMNEAFAASTYDLLWMAIDAYRNLYRSVVVEWIEDHASGAVSCYVFPPHLVQRWPSANAPSSIEEDKMVALQIRWAPNERDNLYRVWLRDKSGKRTAIIVNGVGELVDEQPFGGAAVSPYGEILPLQLVYDEPPLGAAWLPVPESRVAWALGINAKINDLALLVESEAHTNKVFKSEVSGQAPKEIGPDQVIEIVGEKSDFRSERNSPKIEESSRVVDQMLRLWALGEYLPGDIFTTTTMVPMTGQALKSKERDLAKRRARQALLVPVQERAAWTRYAAIHNANAAKWKLDKVAAGARLRVAPGRAWQPLDPVELQNVAFRDLATGFLSRIDYAMERLSLTRPEARAHLKRVRADNKEFPLNEFQNPAAVVDQKAASGPGSATGNAVGKPALTPGLESSTKLPGAMNPEPGTSREGASVTQAVVSNLSSVDRTSRS